MKALLPILAILLISCSSSDEAADQAADEPARGSGVFDELTGTIDRAEGVEDTLRQSAAERRRQIEEAEVR